MLSARIHDFNISDDNSLDHAFTDIRASKDTIDVPVTEFLEVDGQQLLTYAASVCEPYVVNQDGVQTTMACQINSGTIHSQPQNEFIGRSVTPNLSSESFYSCAEPVKLFNTPETHMCKGDDHGLSVGSTPLSLGIESLLSPTDFLLSPHNGLTNTEYASALLSELEALFHSGNGFSTPKDLDLHFLDTSPAADDIRPMHLRSTSFGFQVDSKSLGSLVQCNNLEADGGSLIEQKSSRVNGRQKMARQLNFETPPILRKRRRGSMRGKNSFKTKVSENSMGLDDISDFVEFRMQASPPEMSLFAIEDPFTPSRFLNSPQMVTSTPVCNKALLTSTEALNSEKICGSPSAKRLLWNEFPKTPTPFKASNKENGQRNHVYSDAVKSDIDEEDDITQLPFSAFTALETMNRQDSIIKTEKTTNCCQMTLAKSLDKPCLSSGSSDNIAFIGSLISLETPSKTLIGDDSLMLSPPWVIRDTLHEVLNFNQSTPVSVSCHSTEVVDIPSSSTTIVGWERVACGQTSAQMELVKQAKELLDDDRLNFHPRSLKL